MKSKEILDIVRITQKLRETNEKNGKLSKKSQKDIRKIVELWNEIAERDGNLRVQEPIRTQDVLLFFVELAKIFVPPLLLNESRENNQGPP